MSCPSLWTNLDCVNLDKTRVFLERSKSSAIDLKLYRNCASPSSPFVKFIPCVIGRLRSLQIGSSAGDLRTITTHLSHPAPLLEELFIGCGSGSVLAPGFLNEDLSSLRDLDILCLATELPWRNMVNLTSFHMYHNSSISVRQLLDFFESAPRLRTITLSPIPPITGTQNGRLLSLTCLKDMFAGGTSLHLFDHLLIPVGARLGIRANQLNLTTEGPPPRFLDNLRNLPDFTAVELALGYGMELMHFGGPNGEVSIDTTFDGTCPALGLLAYLDTSKSERLEIKHGRSLTSDLLYRALLPMKHLRTLKLTQCEMPHTLVHALHPTMSPSGAVVCPELKKLVIELEYRGTLDIEKIVGTVAARASRGAKLRTVSIVREGRGMDSQLDVSGLKKHVVHVKS